MMLADFEGSFYNLERVGEDEKVVEIIENYRKLKEATSLNRRPD
jgi:hypothetical protein